MTNYNKIQCPVCNLIWSGNPDDYPEYRNEEFFICTCGESLFRKRELYEGELSPLQPAPYQ